MLTTDLLAPAPGATELSATLNGTLDTPGDTDSFDVELVAGRTYLFSAQGAGGTPVGDLALRIGQPQPIIEDDDGGDGANPLLTFTPDTTGTYSVTVGSSNQGTGGFVIDVREMDVDTAPDTLDPAAPVLSSGDLVYDFLETDGDVDVYRISVEADRMYSFLLSGGIDAATAGAGFPNELNTLLQIYDLNGNLLLSNDDLGSGDLSSGIAVQTFVAGEYYVVASATNAHWGAGYSLKMIEQTLDGNPLDTITWGSTLSSNEVTVYFAGAGEVYGGVTSEGWDSYTINRAMAALGTWAAVADLEFSITNDASSATFRLVTGDLGGDTLGIFFPPGETDAGVGQFASGGQGWNATGGLERGGYGFVTLIHEFGHGLGLAHPHDAGGGSSVMPGVLGPTGTLGPWDLNQTIYTMMSYNDGWLTHPDAAGGLPSPLANYGQPTGPSAFDIAVIQAKYGTVDRATGNTIYLLPEVNTVGTVYQTIWDTGGNDTLRYDGSASARIDLTAATLDYSATGGGVVSFARGVFGGFTIANGVVIENAIGGSGRDTLTGNAAANRLNGRAGADTMTGKSGNDVYVVERSGDLVIEAADEGNDVVESSIDYMLTANVERLTLTGIADLRGTGNELDNLILGNAGANILSGGAGADILRGGAGNDTYFADNVGDRALELDGEGIDRVDASVSYSIAGQYIENLRLTGSADINATGNGLGNNLTGNSGDNRLNGGGGADVMKGGLGDDTYFVDDEGDRVFESVGEGTDIVESRVSYSIAGQYVEHLVLTGSAAINGSGNSLGNVIQGNNAANVINGRGGHDTLFGGGGTDTLFGGEGSDVFWFDSALGGGNVDRIEDFAGGEDVIYLDYAIFSGLAPDGTLAASAFRLGTAAVDADDRILYDAATGNIWYDADGVGGAAAVRFANLAGGLSVSSADFFVTP